MTPRERLDQAVATLPEERVYEVAHFAEFLLWLDDQEKQGSWQAFGRAQLAKAYGVDEPDYTEADLKTRLNP